MAMRIPHVWCLVLALACAVVAGPIGLGKIYEPLPSPIHTVELTYSQQYMVSCSANVVNFYRVSRYPNIYTYQPMLFYGQLTLERPCSSCAISPDGRHLIVFSDANLDVYRLYRLKQLSNATRVFGASGFRTVDPNNWHGDFWIHDSRAESVAAFAFPVRVPEVDYRLSSFDYYPFINESTEFASHPLPPACPRASELKRVSFARDGSGVMLWCKDAAHVCLVTASGSATAYKLTEQPVNVDVLSASRFLAVFASGRLYDSLGDTTIPLDVPVKGAWFSTRSVDAPTIHRVPLDSTPRRLQVQTHDRTRGVMMHILDVPHDGPVAITQRWETVPFTTGTLLDASRGAMAIVDRGRGYLQVDADAFDTRPLAEGVNVTAAATFSFAMGHAAFALWDGKTATIELVLGSPTHPDSPWARITDFYLAPLPIAGTNAELVLHDHGIFFSAASALVALGMLAALMVIYLTQSDVQSDGGETEAPAQTRGVVPAAMRWFHAKIMAREFYVFSIGCAALLAFSAFEITRQPAFPNDWPAHVQFATEYAQHGVTNYDEFMHYHGPCTYPGGFLHLYSLLLKATKGRIEGFQAAWAVLEILNAVVLRDIGFGVGMPYLGLFALASNRMHLYNVRVVTNDLPTVFLAHCALWLTLRRHWTTAAAVLSASISTKLSAVFYGPGLAMIFLANLSLNDWVKAFAAGMAVQVVTSYQFLMTDYRAYIVNAFDLSRTLLWEKTRSFKFVGRIIYDSPFFPPVLLLATLLCIAWYWARLWRDYAVLSRDAGREMPRFISARHPDTEPAATQRATADTAVVATDAKKKGGATQRRGEAAKPESTSLASAAPHVPTSAETRAARQKYRDLRAFWRRSTAAHYVVGNFMFIMFARGLYTPFLCWYLYTFPLVAHAAGLHPVVVLVGWGLHEVLFKGGALSFELWGTFALFAINLSLFIRGTLRRWRY